MFDKIKRIARRVADWTVTQLRERPLETLTAIAGLIIAMVKLAAAITGLQNANTWKREVKRRERKLKLDS